MNDDKLEADTAHVEYQIKEIIKHCYKDVQPKCLMDRKAVQPVTDSATDTDSAAVHEILEGSYKRYV